MSDLNAVIDTYLSIWNEKDETARQSKINEVWAENGAYIDPLAAVSGREDFDKVVAGAQSQFQGLLFERGETFDEHHNVVRFTWNLVPASGLEPIAIGFDVAAVDDTGHITTVYGFIDKMPG